MAPDADVRPPAETLRLDGGREIDGGRWITATSQARSLDIFLRHREMQRRLKEELILEGIAQVGLAPSNQRGSAARGLIRSEREPQIQS